MAISVSQFTRLSVIAFLLASTFIDKSAANTPNLLACDPFESASWLPARAYSDGIRNLDSGQSIRGLIVMIDFPDRKAIGRDREIMSNVVKQVSKFYSKMSEGNIWFNWIIDDQTIHVPNETQHYSAHLRGSIGAAQIIVDVQEALKMGKGRLKPDYMIIVTPSSISRNEVSNSISYLDRDDKIVNSSILAADFWASERNWTILAHEIGHAFGLLDLYNEEAAQLVSVGKASYLDQFDFMKDYDLMNSPQAKSVSLTMWNRLRLTNSIAHRFICFSGQENVFDLIPINSTRLGSKAILVPLSASKLLVVEFRDRSSYDSEMSTNDSGVVTYIIDPKIQSGLGPLRVICDAPSKFRYVNCGLKRGQIRHVEGVKISVLRSLESGERIEIVTQNQSAN